MQKCLKCGKVDGIIKSGKVRGKQRYYCKLCDFSFVLEQTIPELSKNKGLTTIVDIARHLGISVSTVSRALNDKYDINPNTKKLVNQAAIDLDYKPNLIAQSLHKGNSHIIGVVVPEIEHPYFAKMLAGIHNIINHTAYSIIVCHSNESAELEFLHIEKLLSYRVDGILISHSKTVNDFSHILKVINKKVPILNIDRTIDLFDIPKVANNDINGSKELVKHLIACDYKRIAIVSGPENLSITHKRTQGYEEAIVESGFEIDRELMVNSDFTSSGLVSAFESLMNLPNPPDAIFCIFFKDAIDIIKLAKKRNLRIPEQLGVAAFGDDAISGNVEPTLTAYNPNPVKLGEVSVAILLNKIKTKENPKEMSTIIQGELIVRDSTRKVGI
ncbi:MAG: LacI family DNA-binding transcriptional regulator [Cytophagaceae bacterium]|nr:LacI family DNA-binding transcriptional regulator [Cytophagaceae bacterium]MBL0301394.1 LacI family DNA-binding transcriptional regulator [Cytophagaceae bacterium]